MSNLENLTAKIVADGKSKAEKILADARRDADGAVAKAENDASVEGLRTVAAAEDEAKRLKDLKLSAKGIEIRDKKLAAKQQTINNILSETKKRLSGMDKDAYGNFVWKYISGVNITGGETLRIAKNYAGGFDMTKLNEKLAVAGKPQLSLDGSFTEDGFKLVKADAENDFSFDALIDYYRVDLEKTVVERVFQ